MYHAHRYAGAGWAGEPEIDPTLDYAEREQVEGWEVTPLSAMEMAYGAVLREKGVYAGSSTACMLTLNSNSGLLRSAKYYLFPFRTTHSNYPWLAWATVDSQSSGTHH